MTSHVATSSDAQQQMRWRDWQARGAANDRRRASTMRILMLLIVEALTVWLFFATVA